jgi:23S rRNA pseudouridine1911/1915/1917 synthase
VKERVRFRVIPIEHGLALRTLLSRRLPQTDPAKASGLIKAGGVYVNQLRVRVPSVRVAKGERVTVYPGADEVPRIPADQLRFVHREPTFCVIDKPTGTSAEAPRETCLGTLSDALLHLLEGEGVKRPYVGLVHSLDARASGLVLFTTRGVKDHNLQQRFLDLGVRRTYRVLTTRGPAESVTIEAPLVRRRDGSLRLPRDGEAGEPMTTRFEHLGAQGDRHLLEATLDAGPADQLVLHARASGHPILGDEDDESGTALHLCCAAIEFEHPTRGERLSWHAVLPAWAAL